MLKKINQEILFFSLLERTLSFIWSKNAKAFLQISPGPHFPRFRRLAAASFFRFASERLPSLAAFTIGAIKNKIASMQFCFSKEFASQILDDKTASLP